jgi:peroxiredoxin
VVLVFIKDGCPCSHATQPFFNLLFDAYGNHARFFGVFDGSVLSAKKWAKQHQAAFPLLSDPDLRTVHEYKAENSACIALIAWGGKIEKLWPGYSVDMLEDAAERLARLTGVSAKSIDVREAPREMTTGCPY